MNLMKRSVILLTLVLSAFSASAESLYDQLCTFNFNWKQYSRRAPSGDARNFASETEYIQAHLASVLAILRSNPTDHLSAQQLTSRERLTALLDAYRLAGRFPINYYRRERIPVFIDEHNTHCAVGYLMQQSGYGKLANRIAMTDNYVWVKDIHDPEALKWQQLSGFTLDELKLIQGAYDFYDMNARFAPNRIEIPQKPVAEIAYFDNDEQGKKATSATRRIWFKGEGTDGVLHGRWEQNYAIGMPWIVGYYDHGKRTGKWEEYYQGTRQLCRTEHWANDKLNGIRTRFDREGKIIEEIFFKDGNAVTKINYELETGMKYVRNPIDSTLVWTRIYTADGNLIASGNESVYNPGNLKWFQNIELTSLNTMMLTNRDVSANTNAVFNNGLTPFERERNLYNQPPLVEYKKEGKWTYYQERGSDFETARLQADAFTSSSPVTRSGFSGPITMPFTTEFTHLKLQEYDSIHVAYKNDQLTDFIGYGTGKSVHWHVHYHEDVVHIDNSALHIYGGGYGRWHQDYPRIKSIGQYNAQRQRIGEWKHYDRYGNLYKTENFILPKSEEELRGEIWDEQYRD